MRSTGRWATAALCSCSLAFFAGCGAGGPDLAPASGTVTLDGVPVPDASVIFQPKAGGRPSSAITNKAGIYKMSTFEDDDGAIVGEHLVGVVKIGGEGAYALEGASPESDLNALSPIALDSPDGASSKPKGPETIYHVPKKYMEPSNSGLTITVPAEGSDKLDLQLTK